MVGMTPRVNPLFDQKISIYHLTEEGVDWLNKTQFEFNGVIDVLCGSMTFGPFFDMKIDINFNDRTAYRHFTELENLIHTLQSDVKCIIYLDGKGTFFQDVSIERVIYADPDNTYYDFHASFYGLQNNCFSMESR